MGFSCGIVGLPNVGKSTLFNALTATQAAQAAAYPFSTIESNVGRVAVPDERLAVITRLAGAPVTIPTHMDFVDIAGLVRGASRGEGLGNTFLAHIREVDAVVHVLRCFDAPGVSHVEGPPDATRDAEIVTTEVLLTDLDSLERRHESRTKRARGGDRDALEELRVVAPVLAALREGRPARAVTIAEADQRRYRAMNLLTAKSVLYVCNMDEDSAATGNRQSAAVDRLARAEGAASITIAAALEAEIAGLPDPEERRAFLETLGLTETGLDRVIQAGYGLLDLITFFTAGPNEVRAWTLPRGATAVAAAGRIHTDFARGFIRAETMAYEDMVAHGGEQGARNAGKMRQEGRDYVVRDGDVMLFRFNV